MHANFKTYSFVNKDLKIFSNIIFNFYYNRIFLSENRKKFGLLF